MNVWPRGTGTGSDPGSALRPRSQRHRTGAGGRRSLAAGADLPPEIVEIRQPSAHHCHVWVLNVLIWRLNYLVAQNSRSFPKCVYFIVRVTSRSSPFTPLFNVLNCVFQTSNLSTFGRFQLSVWSPLVTSMSLPTLSSIPLCRQLQGADYLCSCFAVLSATLASNTGYGYMQSPVRSLQHSHGSVAG